MPTPSMDPERWTSLRGSVKQRCWAESIRKDVLTAARRSEGELYRRLARIDLAAYWIETLGLTLEQHADRMLARENGWSRLFVTG
jgi:hypothetical protein